ncbi:MAG: c-type cytochrome [Anaerolineae bacterium]
MNIERNLLIGAIATILVVALLVVVYLGEETRMDDETKSQRGMLIARGARLFDSYCAGCHGRRGDGLAGINPPLNVEDLWEDREDIAFYGTLHDYIALNISAGHPTQRMPSWADDYGGPLRNDQIEDLTQFVLNWMGPQPEGVRVEVVEPTPVAEPAPAGTPAPVVAGDPAQGEQVFVTTCAVCHGPDASGSELGPPLIRADVAAKDDDFFRDTIANGRPGTSMPPWSGVLSPQDIEDIIAFLRSKQ